MSEQLLNPYITLEIDYNADEVTIRDAYHKKIRQNGAQSNIQQAYDLIRTKEKRTKYLWTQPSSYFTPPPHDNNTTQSNTSIESLAKELAFLSTWELGDEEML